MLMAVFAAAVLATVSCNKTLEPDEAFLSDTGISLKVRGVTVHTADPLTWQFGYDTSTKEFRASDDGMNEYFFVACSSVPETLGQKLDAKVTWSSEGEVKSDKGEFEVVKIDGDKRWLWCGNKKRQIAVTVRLLK